MEQATRERIEAALAEARLQLQRLVEEANRQVAALQGAIAAYEALLRPEGQAEES